MPASPPYVPPRDAEFQLWFLNYKTLIAATPTNYGLVAGDATLISNQYTAWNAAYVLATTPATRTAANIAAKDVARANAEAVIRPYAQQIRANSAVSDALKVGLGLNLQPNILTPIPPPTSFPNLALRRATPLQSLLSYQDNDSPSGKNKPYGAIGVEIVASVGTAVAVDPDAADAKLIATKAPFAVDWISGQVGKIATLWGRYLTRSGPGGVVQKGPWSPALSFTIL